MNRIKTIQREVEKFRKRIADDLPKGLVEQIIEIQAENDEDPHCVPKGYPRTHNPAPRPGVGE